MSQSNNPSAETEQELNRPETDEAMEHNQAAEADGQEAQAEAVSAAGSDEHHVEVLRAEAEEYKKQAEENYQKLLRVQADYDNFRRRTRQEKEEFAKYASEKLVEQLLPVYDNFDRAIEAGKESTDYSALLKGIEMIFRQFASILESEGVTPIEAVGQPFNPEFHQAVMQVETDEYEEGIVVEELQKGYKMKDKVIRPSMVKVSS